MQGAGSLRADGAGELRLIVTQEVDSHAGLRVSGKEVDVTKASAGVGLLAGVAARAVIGEQVAAQLHRTGSEILVEFGLEFRAALQSPRDVQIGRTLRHEEGGDFRQAVLDGAEIRTIAAALTDVKWRLAETAPGWIQHEEVHQMIHPARLRTRSDIDVDALDRFQQSDAVFGALEDVLHGAVGIHGIGTFLEPPL